MSATVTVRRHRAPDRIAELEACIAQLEGEKAALEKANDQLACDLTRTVIRASQDAMWRAQADEENGRLKARVKELGDKVIRAGAEQERLRQAVINARPKIREVPSAMVRPFAPVVVLPYVSPVPYRSTANDETQQLPVLDQPQKAVWPVYATAATT
ncbi:hypothetical protein GCM10010317_077830 [Streptomyces mirabilis]|uniref:hypothetical protein n=1 Tax=Streptomyces mirabilis TaxID=68239 RepID=UPI00167D16CA|nr:hypothetical protein [Streptomyces mirabilis]GHD70472.1 hypothetical protein GCM10010317_077830 [Streptomyces mirabilis]